MGSPGLSAAGADEARGQVAVVQAGVGCAAEYVDLASGGVPYVHDNRFVGGAVAGWTTGGADRRLGGSRGWQGHAGQRGSGEPGGAYPCGTLEHGAPGYGGVVEIRHDNPFP